MQHIENDEVWLEFFGFFAGFTAVLDLNTYSHRDAELALPLPAFTHFGDSGQEDRLNSRGAGQDQTTLNGISMKNEGIQKAL